MSNFLEIAESQRVLESSVQKMLSDFESKLHKPPGVKLTLNVLSEEFAVFKDQTLALLKVIREQIQALAVSQDNIEMRHRRKYLLLNGLPEVADENVSARISSIITEQLKIPNVTTTSFKACHRLGKHAEGRVRPVLVRFSDISLKSTIWNMKTSLKGTPYALSEFLTPRRHSIFIQARTVFGMKSCWSLDGNIFVKLPNRERVRVESAEDIVRLNTLCSKEQPASTSTPNPVAEEAPDAEVDVVPGPSGQAGRSRRAAKPAS